MTQPPVQDPDYWRKRTREIASEYGLDPNQFYRLIDWESGSFAPDVISGQRRGGAGEVGLGQIHPSNLAAGAPEWTDPEANLRWAANYMRGLGSSFSGDWRKAYAAYGYGETGFRESVLAPYGTGWEQGMGSDAPAQYNKLQYVMGGPASEAALAPPRGMEREVYQRGLISGGIRLAPRDPFADIPEFFPGYRQLLDDKLDSIKLLAGQVQTAHTSTMSHVDYKATDQELDDYLRKRTGLWLSLLNKPEEYLRWKGLTQDQIDLLRHPEYIAAGLAPAPEYPYASELTGVKGPASMGDAAQIIAKARRELEYIKRAQAQPLVDEQLLITDTLIRESAMLTMMQVLPLLISSDDVHNVDEAINWFRQNAVTGMPLPGMSHEDLMSRKNDITFTQQDRETISYLINNLSPVLDLNPDATADEVMEALGTKNRPTPKLLSAMTADQIHNMLFGISKPFEMPGGITEPELRTFFRRRGMTDEEYLETVAGARKAASDLALAWFNQQQAYLAYREGITVPEIPDISMLDRLNQIVTQPAQALSDAMEVFRENVSKPFATMGVLGISQIGQWVGLPPLAGVESIERSLRNSDEGFWDSLATAYDDWDAPGVAKFAAEVGFDPTTYLGFGIYTKVTRGIPILGPVVSAAERGWVKVTDIPFRAIGKGYRTLVPKTLQQIAAEHGTDAARDVIAAYTYHNNVMSVVGTDNANRLVPAVNKAIQEFVQNPGTNTGPMWEYGARILNRFKKLIPSTEVKSWSKFVKGVNEVTQQVVHDVNVTYSHLYSSGVHGFLKPEEAVEQFLRILGADLTKENMDTLAQMVSRKITQDAAAAPRMLRGSVDQALDAIANTAERVFIANAESDMWEFAEHSGAAMGLAKFASGPLMWSPLMWLDRFAVRPVASAYLLFLGYGPINYIESLFRVGRAGFMPNFTAGPHEYEFVWVSWGYIRNSPDELALRIQARSEIAILPNPGETTYTATRKMGLLPGITRELPLGSVPIINKIPRALWSLQNFNDFWSRVSTYQRALYIHKQMLKQLHEVAPKEMELIGGMVRGLDKLNIKSLSNSEIKELGEYLVTSAIHSPDSVAALRTTAEKLQARKYIQDLNKVFAAHPEIERPYADALLRMAQRGELTRETIDGAFQRTFSAIQDDYLAKLPARARMLERWEQEIVSSVDRRFTNTGWRAGQVRESSGGMATEGRGLYVYGNKLDADYFAEAHGLGVHEVGYKAPSNPLKARVGDAVVSEPEILLEPIKSGDSEWRQLLKHAAGNVGMTPRNMASKIDSGELADEITRLVRSRGHDAVVFYTEQGDVGWSVLMDSTLWSGSMSKQEAYRAFRQVADIQESAVDVVDTHRRVSTRRASDIRDVEAKDAFHRQAREDSLEFESQYESSVRRVLDSLRANATQVFAEGTERTNMLRILDNLEDQYTLTRDTWGQVRDLFDTTVGAAKNAKERAAAWPQFLDGRVPIWDNYFAKIDKMKSDYELAAALIDPGGIRGQISPSVGRLTPAHVARLFASTGDDLSRGLIQIETMTIMDRDRFIQMVHRRANTLATAMGQTADDMGFSPEAIGRVYDQLMAKLKLDPNIGGALEPLRQSLEGVRIDTHKLAASKGIPQSDVDQLNQFFDDVATKLKGSGLFTGPTPELPWTTNKEMLEATARGEKPITLISGPERGTAEALGLEVEKLPVFEGWPDRLEVFGAYQKGNRAAFDRLNSAIPRTKFGGVNVTPLRLDAPELVEAHPAIGRALGYPEEAIADFMRMYPGSRYRPPAGIGRWEATPEWAALREKAMAQARTQYELDFTQYTRQNAFDAYMRRLFPFWTYESQRWPYLARAAVQTPGIFTTWGKYMDYSDTGYIPMWDFDLQINLFRGTVLMGGFRRFFMRDYPEYYNRIPGANIIDYMGRAGFYPGIHVTLPMALWGGERTQLGEVLPSYARTALGFASGFNLPGAKQLQELVFPDRFRDYQISLEVSRLAQARRLDFSGPDITRKMRMGKDLTPEEQRLWDEASRRINRIDAMLFQTTGMFRFSPEERVQAWKAVAEMREALTGVSVADQEKIREWEAVTGNDFTDIFPLDPTDQDRLNQLDAYQYWVGTSSTLIPEPTQRLKDKISSYWEQVGDVWDRSRSEGFYDEEGNQKVLPLRQLDEEFRAGTITADDYSKLLGDSIDYTIGLVEGLGNSDEYKDVPKTLRQRLDYYEEHNIPLPTFSPGQELTWMYYELSPKLEKDEGGNYVYNFVDYYARVDAILESMPDAIRSRFLDYIQREWTPTQKLYWEVSRDYLRPYRNLRDTLIEQYTPEEQKVLRQYTHAEGAELEALKDIQTAEGEGLISSFESKLRLTHKNYRETSPETDAWLYFWGKTETLSTKESEAIYLDLLRRFRPGMANNQSVP